MPKAAQFKRILACEQALRGALYAGREKVGELAPASLEFEYLLRKSRCETLINGDDISNDVITIGTCLSMFVYIRACFGFALIGGNLTALSTKSHRGIGSSPSFSRPPRRACSQAKEYPRPNRTDSKNFAFNRGLVVKFARLT